MTLLVDFRRQLHARPELAHTEYDTANSVIEFINRFTADNDQLTIRSGIGGTGVLASFDSGVAGPQLLIRAELDALPIAEHDGFEHRSNNAGISHKCGHDGHTAIVAGLAEPLATKPIRRGTVHLLFQPAEETGTGAAAVLADATFADIQCDFAVAIHNMPGWPLHSVVVRPGPMTMAVRSLILRFTGRTAHASEPHLGENPTLAIADLLRWCNDFDLNQPADPDFRLTTPVHVLIGSPAYGVAAGAGEAHLTLRAADNVRLSQLEQRIITMAQQFAGRDRLELAIETVENFAANVNDAATTALIVSAATSCGLEVIEPEAPMVAGEDFGLFSERFPTCMALLGAGIDHDPLHNPNYDFPDELLVSGLALFDALITNSCR